MVAHSKTHMSGLKLSKKKTKFIAEIASSHNGSEKNFIDLITYLKTSKVDFVKIQVFKTDDLAHKSFKFYKILKKINLNYKVIDKAIKLLIKNKKKIILEPFDDTSYIFCKKYCKKAYLKISSSEVDNKYILMDALKNFKLIFLSIPAKKISNIKNLLKNFKKFKRKIILTYGFQSFPTDYKDLRLSIIREIKKFHSNVCYADHTTSNDLSKNLMVISKSIELGANFIEKHITLNRFKNFPDSDSSLDKQQFEEFLNFFKTKIPEKKNISLKEKYYSTVMRKYAVTKKNINKNSLVNVKDIKFLRTNTKGIDKVKFFKLKNLVTNKKLKKNEILQTKFFK